MRRVSLIAMILVAAFSVPVAAQDRLEDRVVVNTFVGPGFVGDAAVVNMRAAAGVKATDWLAVVGEWGSLSKPNDKVVSGQHFNGNVQVMTPNPIYRNIRPYATVGVGTFRMADGILTTSDRSDVATNLGAGLAYDFNRWFGVNFDYRRFFIDRDDFSGANRYTLGLNFGLR